jgi:putative phosphonate metabolism protein
MTERFAIYFAPSATSNLWERAAVWLGRDADDGELFSGAVAGIDRNRLLNLTQSANRYGFHATLKAPMRLDEGMDEAALRNALRQFAARYQPLDLGRLHIASLDGFLALVTGDNAMLQDFAAIVVTEFDAMRAPMTERERAARAAGLSPRQLELLDLYGYPYVLEQFRFHMTLTDRLEQDEARDIAAAAATWFGPVLDAPVLLDRLCLFHEPDAGKPFRRIADFKLGVAG